MRETTREHFNSIQSRFAEQLFVCREKRVDLKCCEHLMKGCKVLWSQTNPILLHHISVCVCVCVCSNVCVY